MTNAEARCNKSLRPRKPEGSLGRTAQDVHLHSHTAPELCLTQLPGSASYTLSLCLKCMFAIIRINASLHVSFVAISSRNPCNSPSHGRFHVFVTVFPTTVWTFKQNKSEQMHHHESRYYFPWKPWTTYALYDYTVSTRNVTCFTSTIRYRVASLRRVSLTSPLFVLLACVTGPITSWLDGCVELAHHKPAWN